MHWPWPLAAWMCTELCHAVAASARGCELFLARDVACTQKHCYASGDCVLNDGQAAADGPKPVEVLNSMTSDSMQQHVLKLKAGCMVTLMHNMDKDLGLVNRTRMIVRAFPPGCVNCEVASGIHKGRRMFMPRMIFTNDKESGLCCSGRCMQHHKAHQSPLAGKHSAQRRPSKAGSSPTFSAAADFCSCSMAAALCSAGSPLPATCLVLQPTRHPQSAAHTTPLR